MKQTSTFSTSNPSQLPSNATQALSHTEQACFAPKDSTIQNILNFSKAYQVETTEKLGKVGFVMN